MATFVSAAKLGCEEIAEEKNPGAAPEGLDEEKPTAAAREEPRGYVFSADDSERWLAHLQAEGFVVLAGAASADDVARASSLLWDAIESASGSPAEGGAAVVRRDEPATWARADGLIDARGFVLDGRVTQSAGAWFVRALPRVRDAFAAIWSTRALISSMDTVIVWRPWWGRLGGGDAAAPAPPPHTEGLHLDQNPVTKPEFACVQGMMPLRAVTRASGGLEVVPRSHLPAAKHALTRARDLRRAGDWCPLPAGYYPPGAATLVACSAGDLVLWDSRVVHGGRVGEGGGARDELARMSLAVCMVPRDRATARVLAKRREGFEKGKTFTHWPDELRYAHSAPAEYTPIELTPEQAELL